MNPLAQQKNDGLRNAMSHRQDRELLQAKQKYEQMIKMNMNNPDEGLIANYKYHLNMIKSELGRRHPKPKRTEPKVEVSFDASMDKKESSIDDLKKYLTKTQEQAASDKLSAEQNKAKAKEIENEIANLDTKNESVKNKNSKSASTTAKKNIVIGIGFGAAIGAFAGWKMGYNIIGFAIGGAALGTGVALIINKKAKATLVPKT